MFHNQTKEQKEIKLANKKIIFLPNIKDNTYLENFTQLNKLKESRQIG